MRRIIRRNLVRDPIGRALSTQSERVTDNGQGTVHFTVERSAAWCSGCRRPIADLSEMRGVCDWCRVRACCTHCLSQCAVCSRRLCGHCRRGFAGPPVLTVCTNCQQRLIHRQMLADQHLQFERELAVHRQFNQDQSLRLNYERTDLALQLQAARMGFQLVRGKKSFLRRLWALSRGMLAKVLNYARRPLC